MSQMLKRVALMTKDYVKLTKKSGMNFMKMCPNNVHFAQLLIGIFALIESQMSM